MYSRVYVEITNICNMHCSFCHGHSRKPDRMTREAFSAVLKQLAGKTSYIYYHLMGEPLTHPLLPEFLRMAAGKGFRSVITTNGTLLRERGEAILAAGVHKVNISLHSFEKDDLQAYRSYLHQIVSFIHAALNAGTIVSLRLWNKGYDQGRNDTVLQLLHKAFPRQWTQNSRGYRICDKLYLEWGERFQWPDKEAADQGQQVFCYGMQDHFGILCDGSVVPCCLDSDGVIALGNVFREDLSEILSSPRAVALAQGFACRTATEDLCRRCGYARRFS